MPVASGTEPFRGARIDRAEFDRIAREVFGIELEVELTRNRTRDWGYHVAIGGWAHKINIHPWHRTIEDACRTLAHELWHALDSESKPWPEYVARHKSDLAIPHGERECERDAAAAEDALWTELLPCMNPRKTKEVA